MIAVMGDCESAQALRAYLRTAELLADRSKPLYTIMLREEASLNAPIVDGVRCPLESEAKHEMHQLGINSFFLARGTGEVFSDDKLLVIHPPKDTEAVSRGLYRAICKVLKIGQKKPWWKLTLFLLLLAVPVQAQTPICVWDSVAAKQVCNTGDSTNKAIRVNVIASTGGGGTVTQGAGFGVATGFWNVRLTDGTNFYNSLTDTQLRASAVPVTTTLLPAALVGGRLDTNLGSWFGSTAPTIGQKTSASSIPVVIASNQSTVPVFDSAMSAQLPVSLDGFGFLAVHEQGTASISGPVSQSGTWVVQPGNTANTVAWLVTTPTGTFAVSAVSLPLPANAAQETGGNLATIASRIPALVNNSQPVIIQQSLVPVPPVLSSRVLGNPLLMRAAMQQYCQRTICPPGSF